jgi:integrase
MIVARQYPLTESQTLSINASVLKRVKASGQRFTLRDTTVEGLILRVGASGTTSWYIDYRNRDGKRCLFRFGNTKNYNPEEAKAEARRLNGLLASGEDLAAERREAKQDIKRAEARTLQKYLEGDYKDHVLDHRKDGKATEKRIKAAWVGILDVDLATLTTERLKAIRTRRLKKVKPQTFNRDYNALHALLNAAVDDKLIASNPLSAVKRPKVSDDKRVRYLGQRDDHEDIRDENDNKLGERVRLDKALGDVATPKYLQVMTRFALNTGMRRGEIFQLRWSTVNFKQRQITVTAATAKGNKTRHVPMNKAVVGILKAWKKGQGNVVHIDGLVFPNPDTGEAFTTIKKSWATLTDRAQLYDFHFHDCRHDFCSRLVMAGIPLIKVRDLAGHSSIIMTERYSHLAPKHLQDAVEVLS